MPNSVDWTFIYIECIEHFFSWWLLVWRYRENKFPRAARQRFYLCFSVFRHPLSFICMCLRTPYTETQRVCCWHFGPNVCVMCICTHSSLNPAAIASQRRQKAHQLRQIKAEFALAGSSALAFLVRENTPLAFYFRRSRAYDAQIYARSPDAAVDASYALLERERGSRRAVEKRLSSVCVFAQSRLRPSNCGAAARKSVCGDQTSRSFDFQVENSADLDESVFTPAKSCTGEWFFYKDTDNGGWKKTLNTIRQIRWNVFEVWQQKTRLYSGYMLGI